LSIEQLFEDKELFNRIAQGDEQAFTTIFYRYTATIYPFVLSKAKSKAAAEEIVQDVFLKLWTKRELLTGMEAPSSYLMRIATNRTLDYLRRKAVEQKILLQVGNAEEHNPIENELSFKEAKRLLDDAIAQMPLQRRTIYLLQQEGFTYDEIAARLSISAHTVRNHLALATKSLKDYLHKHGLSLFIILFLLDR